MILYLISERLRGLEMLMRKW